MLILGLFLVLAGSGIIRIEKITVTPGRRTLGFGGILAIAGLLFLLPSIRSAFLPQSTTQTDTPSVATLMPIPSETQQTVIATNTLALSGSMTLTASPTPAETIATTVAAPRTTTGPWTGSVGNLELIVNKVELIGFRGDKKLLRFYMTVNNQTNDAIQLPLFGYFSAIDNNGMSYEADVQISNWPNNFPPGQQVSGSIDLISPVPQSVSSMSVGFSTIFGSLQLVGKSISVDGISTP
jgi:Telomeric repeat-binding factor 2.